ncbi:cysteine desulfurase family protein [uncultured Eubacterium sp.]|uniref:cysteine desulfurase family protein n=1 Tax=uncultured Eubacterium sp. TaxID=165185 RepID=UPI002628113E|nr:IscS subfamily cysteine desulfurase [uncultured Eubacterium sp.]
MFIYADNAATTKTSEAATKAMVDIMNNVYGNPSSLHTTGQKAKEVLEKARLDVAKCIGANFKEIYFTSGGSEADNQAIISAARFGARKNKKHIVSTKIEHHAVLHTLNKLEKEGFEVTLLDVPENGIVKVEDVNNAIREDTALVTIMYANNEIGTIQPIKEIGAICKEKGVIFHTDAVQAVGHINIDVNEDNIDMLSFSGHKFYGPEGVGVLFARQNIPLVNVIEGGAQERGKRAGTENLPAIVGMAVALKDACSNIEETAKKEIQLRDRLIEGLSTISHSMLNGDKEKRLPGNVNFIFEGIEGESLLLLLDARGIEASSGSACTSGSLDPSHVLLAIGRPHEVAHGSLRLTINSENTLEEMDYIVEQTKEVVEYLRGISPVWEAMMKKENVDK